MAIIAQPDKKTVIKELTEIGKSKGKLTTKEILDAIGEIDFDPESLEKFYDQLESMGIEIVDDIEDFEDIPVVDIASQSPSSSTPSEEPGNDSIAIDDPVK